MFVELQFGCDLFFDLEDDAPDFFLDHNTARNVSAVQPAFNIIYYYFKIQHDSQSQAQYHGEFEYIERGPSGGVGVPMPLD